MSQKELEADAEAGDHHISERSEDSDTEQQIEERQPQIDTCNRCKELSVKIKSASLGEAAKMVAVAEKMIHERCNKKFYTMLKNTTAECKARDDFAAVAFDYMQNLQLPFNPVQNLFYLLSLVYRFQELMEFYKDCISAKTATLCRDRKISFSISKFHHFVHEALKPSYFKAGEGGAGAYSENHPLLETKVTHLKQMLHWVDDEHNLFYEDIIKSSKRKASSAFAGIPAIGDNYELIWNSPVDRYRDTRTLANTFLKQILNFKALHMECETGLRLFLEKFATSVAAFENLDINNKTKFIFVYLALSKLDASPNRMFELSRDKKGDLPTYKEIVEFMKSQTFNRVTCLTKPNFAIATGNSSLVKSRQTNSFVVNKIDTTKCVVCSQTSHQVAYRCPKFKSLAPTDRYKISKEKKLCLNCFSTQYQINACKSKERFLVYRIKHHTLLYFNKVADSSNNNSSNVDYLQITPASVEKPQISDTHIDGKLDISLIVCSSTSTHRRNQTILLSTAVVNCIDRLDSIHKIRVLLDSGLQSNFTTVSCCQKLQLPATNIHTSALGVGNVSRPVRDRITNSLPSLPVDTNFTKHLENVDLADKTFSAPSPIDGIVGAYMYSRLLGSARIVETFPSPIALQTTLGFVVMNSVPALPFSQINETQALYAIEPIETFISKFWELQEVLSAPVLSTDDVEYEQIYASNLIHDATGRYTVSLPFRDSPTLLGDSYTTTYSRFRTLENRFRFSPEFRNLYCDAVREQIENGFMSPASQDDMLCLHYFIPHHGVSKPQSTSTPLRKVFDCSARSSREKVLKDILHASPQLQTDIVTILINFRLFPIAVTADLKKIILRHLGIYKGMSVSLIEFADASGQGYQGAVYLRINVQDNFAKVSLVCAMFKVAAIKTVSINRLELYTALLMAKLLRFVVDTYSLRIKIDQNWAFSESTVALNWIHASPNRWNTFVANCPEWLISDNRSWLIRQFTPDNSSRLEETTYSLPVVITNKTENPLYGLILRFSSWPELLNTHNTTYVLRFLKLLPKNDRINATDLERAEFTLSLFKEFILTRTDNLISGESQLRNGNLTYDQQHPILLPKRDHLVNLVIDYTHRNNLHTGPDLVVSILRQKYWILDARSVKELAQKRIERNLNPPKTPHMGGIWEAQNKSTKHNYAKLWATKY
ncbi:hypothetical protein ILUMI_10325 [Ignelater luminosus]|uniref:Peptidase aspartic putative domain-containing protein n=1 Tax=Ignelater luminosus TaxID=2038154 RepID=A0A8K0CY55_IGNLU|nr:hypothetical protein ILUMI_10325 [Ignelater luminosus]